MINSKGRTFALNFSRVRSKLVWKSSLSTELLIGEWKKFAFFFFQIFRVDRCLAKPGFYYWELKNREDSNLRLPSVADCFCMSRRKRGFPNIYLQEEKCPIGLSIPCCRVVGIFQGPGEVIAARRSNFIVKTRVNNLSLIFFTARRSIEKNLIPRGDEFFPDHLFFTDNEKISK